MDDAEKPFVKKVPKTDKTDPKRLRKDLPKLVKSITGEDRVLLIGTSNKPWDGDQKLLYQTYDKVIYIPRPDYGTVSLIWKDLLYKVSKSIMLRRQQLTFQKLEFLTLIEEIIRDLIICFICREILHFRKNKIYAEN